MGAALVYFVYRMLHMGAYVNGEWKQYLVPAAVTIGAVLLEKISQIIFIMFFKQALRRRSRDGVTSMTNLPAAAAAYPIAPAPAVAAYPVAPMPAVAAYPVAPAPAAYPVPTAQPNNQWATPFKFSCQHRV